ncbi:hypothetical protein EVAR_89226_1 [Eumeta japonica]|uniref:DUF5641 domain-containing protein n=1 Tax=Eumeta variegata TaxID=151549 RepID=A0A4C1T5Q2_EUMVA|nr:hypothetical protein EVAR_89226_1 [Eumeta japonica]
MGGSWERLVRSIKVALSATLHTRAPKTKYYTLLLEAEFVVNSRPLTHIVASESGARRDVLAEMAARIPPHAAETSQVDRGPPIKVGDAVVITDPALPRNTWPRGIVERVYPGIDGQVRVVDIRTAHGRLRRPTARLAVLPTEVESSRSDRGGLLTAELRPPARVAALIRNSEARVRGVGPLIGRAVRDAHGKAAALGAQRCYMRARPATVSPPSTADEKHSLYSEF